MIAIKNPIQPEDRDDDLKTVSRTDILRKTPTKTFSTTKRLRNKNDSKTLDTTDNDSKDENKLSIKQMIIGLLIIVIMLLGYAYYRGVINFQ
jgi:hypothetical protein